MSGGSAACGGGALARGGVQRIQYPLGLLQRELAARAGVSESFIGQVERGCKHCSAESAARLSRALELSADELMFGD